MEQTFEYRFQSGLHKVRVVRQTGNEPKGMISCDGLRLPNGVNWFPVYVPESAVPQHLRPKNDRR